MWQRQIQLIKLKWNVETKYYIKSILLCSDTKMELEAKWSSIKDNLSNRKRHFGWVWACKTNTSVNYFCNCNCRVWRSITALNCRLIIEVSIQLPLELLDLYPIKFSSSNLTCPTFVRYVHILKIKISTVSRICVFDSEIFCQENFS